MKRFGSIYIITNTITGRQYIGQTVQAVRRRFKAHLQNKRNKSILRNSILSHGKNNFKVEELVICFDKEALNYYEKLLIQQYNTLYPSGYNQTSGGRDYEFVDEVKQRMRKAKLGTAFHSIPHEWDMKVKMAIKFGAKPILATDLKTGNKTWYLTSREPSSYDKRFDYRLVNACCLKKRPTHQKHTFEYCENANQSGSTEIKSSEHAQRLESDLASANYNLSTSPRPPRKI